MSDVNPQEISSRDTVQTTAGDSDPFHELSSNYITSTRTKASVADWPPRATALVKSYLVDWVCIAAMLVLLAVWWAEPPKYYFRLDDESISFPSIEETISSTVIILIIVLGPLGVVLFTQVWVRSFRDFHQSAMATIELFAATQLTCTFIWFSVGGLRPNFLALCDPDPTRETPINTVPHNPSVGYLYYSDNICTCSVQELYRAKHSFPSGHAASITAVCIYLMIYLCAKLKLYDNKSHFWKFVIVVALMIIDLWISFSRVRDGRHHFSDTIIGIIIGAIIAPLVYRLNFCSLMGPDNHIPTRYTWTGRFLEFANLKNLRLWNLRHNTAPPQKGKGSAPVESSMTEQQRAGEGSV